MLSSFTRGRTAAASVLAAVTVVSTLALSAPANAAGTPKSMQSKGDAPSARITPGGAPPTNVSAVGERSGLVVTGTPQCYSNYKKCATRVKIPSLGTDLWDIDTRQGHTIAWPANWDAGTSASVEVYTTATNPFGYWYYTNPPVTVTATRPAAERPITAKLESQDDAGRSARVSGTATPQAEIRRGGSRVATADGDGRWSATVSGLTVGSNRLEFSQVVDGTVKDSATVDVTIAKPAVPNGGVAAQSGPSTALTRGEAVEVPFGARATSDLASAAFTVTLTAPEGTTFAPQTSVIGALSTDGSTFTRFGSLGLQDVHVDGRTLTGTFDSSRHPGFALANGHQLRWYPTLVAAADATAGNATMGFKLAGSTDLGSANVTGSTTVTVPEETGVPAPTAEVVFDDDVTKRARVEGTAQDGAVVIVADATGRELGRPTVTDGRYSLEVVSPGAGEHEFTVTQEIGGVTSDAATARGDFGAAVTVDALPAQVVAGDVTISGTGETGRSVEVRVGPVTLPAVTVAAGRWSVSTELKPSSDALAVEVSQIAQGSTITTASATTTPDGAITARPVTIDEPSSHRYLPKVDTRVSGTATPYATVRFTSGTSVFQPVTADKNGNWAFEREFGPTHVYSIVATQTRFDGTTSSSEAFELRPTQSNRPLVVTSPESGDTHTGGTVTFTGTGTPDARVRALVQGSSEIVFDYVRVGIDNRWTATAQLTAGREYVIEFRQTTPDGTFDNVRDFRLAPDQPAWKPAALTSPSNGHTYNPNADVEFTGTGAPGTTIVGVTSTGTTVTPAGGVKVQDDGTWAFSQKMGPSVDYTITFTATRGADSNTFTLSDLRYPRYSALTLTSPTATDRYTPDVPFRFEGTASPYARISAVTSLGTDLLQHLPPVYADEHGDWSFTRAYGPTRTYTIDLGQVDAYGVGEPDEVDNFIWAPVS